jgi:hypothetical protein
LALHTVYQKRIEAYSHKLKAAKKHDRLFSAFRFAIILLAAFAGYLYLSEKWAGFLYIALALVMGFVAVLFRHLKLRKHIKDLKNFVRINENEKAYLKGDLMAFDGGTEWVKGDHLFSNDLDLFGTPSLFQHINRTVTLAGKKKLASSLLSGNANTINYQQQAVQELNPMLDWRQGFLVSARDIDENPNLVKHLQHWLSKSSKKSRVAQPWLLYPLAIIAIALGVYWLISPTLQHFNWFTYAFGLNLVLVFSQYKFIKKEYDNLNAISKSLTLYSELLRHIENQEFNSLHLQELKSNLASTSGKASATLGKLSKLLDGFDQMNNVVALLVTNGLYHYHLHVLNGLYMWKKNHGRAIYQWLDTVAEFDQLVSKANYAYNHPQFTYPKVAKEPVLKANNMGHPMISETKRVNNSLSFDDFRYAVLTGSNMSGKSTFLRSIGVNMVLMKAGLPVCATQMAAYPFTLLSSMKVVDSLDKDESYFQAEVIRLKRIQTVLNEGQPCLVLLDEILRGTNSEDKRNGTRLYMEKIANNNAIGVIATHDIDIADLAQKQSGVFKALYFESKVKEGELLFDYKLRQGICTTPNATDLMRAQGII